MFRQLWRLRTGCVAAASITLGGSLINNVNKKNNNSSNNNNTYASANQTQSTNSTSSFNNSTRPPRVRRILFTGGPCGGKTTALSTTQQFLMNHGFLVYTIPESSTIYRLAGIMPDYYTGNYFQNIVTSLQTNLENFFYYFGEKASIIYNKPVIILIDRGILDGKAYIESNEKFLNVLNFAGHESSKNRLLFENIEKKYNNNNNDNNSSNNDGNIDININLNNDSEYTNILHRYDLVLHLVSASKGASKFYKLEPYRHESLHEAIELDDKIISIYNKHENRKIVYNDNTFDEKINLIIYHIANYLNIPNMIRTPLKYTVKIKDTRAELGHSHGEHSGNYLGVDDIDSIIDSIKQCCESDNVYDNDSDNMLNNNQLFFTPLLIHKTFISMNNKNDSKNTKIIENTQNNKNNNNNTSANNNASGAITAATDAEKIESTTFIRAASLYNYDFNNNNNNDNNDGYDTSNSNNNNSSNGLEVDPDEHDTIKLLKLNNQQQNYMLVDELYEFGQKMTTSVNLDVERYNQYKTLNINKNLSEIEMYKINFAYKGVYYSLELFVKPNNAKNLIFLKIYRPSGKKCIDADGNLTVDLPKCIIPNQNITHDPIYTTYGIASGKI